MRKHVIASLIATSALLLSSAAAPLTFAAPADAPGQAQAQAQKPGHSKKDEGRPTITEDNPTGYYFWRDDGFHLRTHGPRAEHDFDAVLRTKGTFENVSPVRLEPGDKVEVLKGGHELVIHFHTFDFTDGVNFTIRDGERLRLNLKLDFKSAPTDQIFLGAKGRHPKKTPSASKGNRDGAHRKAVGAAVPCTS